jgi:hypothetical protein
MRTGPGPTPSTSVEPPQQEPLFSCDLVSHGEVEPAGLLRDVDLLDAWVVGQPLADFRAGVGAEVVGDDPDGAAGVSVDDLAEQPDPAVAVVCRGAVGDLGAVADAQGAEDPGLLGAAGVLQGALMRWPSGDQPGAGGKVLVGLCRWCSRYCQVPGGAARQPRVS